MDVPVALFGLTSMLRELVSLKESTLWMKNRFFYFMIVTCQTHVAVTHGHASFKVKEKKKKEHESVWIGWKLCNITFAFLLFLKWSTFFFIRRHLTFMNRLLSLAEEKNSSLSFLYQSSFKQLSFKVPIIKIVPVYLKYIILWIKYQHNFRQSFKKMHHDGNDEPWHMWIAEKQKNHSEGRGRNVLKNVIAVYEIAQKLILFLLLSQ